MAAFLGICVVLVLGTAAWFMGMVAGSCVCDLGKPEYSSDKMVAWVGSSWLGAMTVLVLAYGIGKLA